MANDRRRPDPKPRKRTIVGELQALIQSLQGLYWQVSSTMLHDRMQPRPRPPASRDEIPIKNLLGDRIDRTAAAARKAGLVVTDEDPFDAASPGPSPAAKDSVAPGPAGGLFGALSQHFGRHRGATLSQPYLHEKMRKNTLEHINKALILARVGDIKGAKIHAELAATAMQTAGDYMSDEEYSRFREEVEGRLHAASDLPSS